MVMCPVQTFSQYLATLGGAANKQTSLQSTLQEQNIAGLYKQQTTDDQFKVGSPSGSVYWTAGAQQMILAVPHMLQCETHIPHCHGVPALQTAKHPLRQSDDTSGLPSS